MFENVSPDLVGPTGPIWQILVSGQETHMPSPVKLLKLKTLAPLRYSDSWQLPITLHSGGYPFQ